jgi:drug/metabolite transporter (DMT)-like permease
MSAHAEDTTTRTRQLAAVGLILASCVLIAAVPNFAKLAYDGGASIPAFLIGRWAVSVLLLGAALLTLRRRFGASRKVLLRCVLGGGAAALASFGFLGSIASIDISLAILIFYLHPVVLAWIGQLRGTYRLTATRLCSCAIILVGLSLALSVRFAQLAPSGIALAFLGALAASAMLVANGDAVQEAGSILVNFYTALTALCVICIASVITGDVVVPVTALGWFGVVGAGAAFCLGLVLFFAAIPAIDLARASLIAIVEPLLGILLAMALFGEQLDLLQWLGVAIVLAGLALLELPPGAIQRMIGRKVSIT